MSKKINPTVLGAFVLGGVGLLVAALFLFGSGDFLQERYHYRLYFRDSMGGLDVGAPVEFRGVRIGTVTAVDLVLDPETGASRVPVTVAIEPERMKLEGAPRRIGAQRLADLFVERGLRAELMAQSFLTGKLKINFDLRPDLPGQVSGLQEEFPELPTMDSTLRRAQQKLSELPLAEILSDTRAALGALAGLLGSEEARASLKDLSAVLAELRLLAAKVNQQADPLMGNINELAAGLKPVLANLESISRNMETLTSPEAPLRQEAEASLAELRRSLQSLRNLLDYLEQHPESLLRGKP